MSEIYRFFVYLDRGTSINVIFIRLTVRYEVLTKYEYKYLMILLIDPKGMNTIHLFARISKFAHEIDAVL